MKKNADQKKTVIVIPGYMGTTLRDPRINKEIWGGLSLIWADFEKLSTVPDKAVLYHDNLVAEHPLWPVYPSLIRHLKRQNFDVHFFGYDWRCSIQDLVNDLNSLINRIGVEQISFVVHSMGGLIALAWMAEQARIRVNKYVGIGVPIFGADLALQVMLKGDSRLTAMNLRFSPDKLQRFTWRIPSLYELLPPLAGIYEKANWPEKIQVKQTYLSQAQKTRVLIEKGLKIISSRPEDASFIVCNNEPTLYWPDNAGNKLDTTSCKQGLGDGWIYHERAYTQHCNAYGFVRSIPDSLTLKLHLPTAFILGSHPLLPMFHRIHKAVTAMLNDESVESLPVLHSMK